MPVASTWPSRMMTISKVSSLRPEAEMRQKGECSSMTWTMVRGVTGGGGFFGYKSLVPTLSRRLDLQRNFSKILTF